MKAFLETGNFSVATMAVMLCALTLALALPGMFRTRTWWWSLALAPPLLSCALYLVYDRLYDHLPLAQCLDVFDKAWTWYEASVAAAMMIQMFTAQLSFISWRLMGPSDEAWAGLHHWENRLLAHHLRLCLFLLYPFYAICTAMSVIGMRGLGGMPA
jgi:hypothetical protein